MARLLGVGNRYRKRGAGIDLCFGASHLSIDLKGEYRDHKSF
jgi:hypothetical protein